jgi:hypothetical protein
MQQLNLLALIVNPLQDCKNKTAMAEKSDIKQKS